MANGNRTSQDIILDREVQERIALALESSAGLVEVNDLTMAVVWADIPDANVPESAVTQHTAALTITESQISDLQSYLTAEVNDLSAAVTWANIPDANVPQSAVTQHEAALTITESQISDLQAYLLTAGFADLDTDLGDFTGIGIGYALDNPKITVSSNGTTITLSLQDNPTGDIRFLFTDGVYTHDCTPADTVALTAGTDISPILNYVYILQSTKTLTASTSGWPGTEHAKLGTVLCQSAASLQTDGAYKVHAWTNHTTNDIDGELAHFSTWIRNQNATWTSGALVTPTVGVATFDLAVSAGSILQLHPHASPSFDTSLGSEVMIPNDNTTAYKRVGDLTGELTDANGVSMSNRYYNLVVWMVVSEDDGDSQLMVNLPTASYLNESDAQLDSSATAVFDIPTDFRGTGVLLARLTIKHNSGPGSFVLSQNTDLRGLTPATSVGGGGGGAGSLDELSDVFNSAPVDRHVLVYDGVTDNRYENRLLVEADISDLQAYGFGDVTKVGTPADNQVGVWTGDGTIEGTAGFTFDVTQGTLNFDASGFRVNHAGGILMSSGSGSIYFANAATPAIDNVAGTGNVPNIRPNKGDLNSGLGLKTFDAPSMVAGGVEAHRWAELNGGVIQVPKGNTAVTAFAGGGQASATQLNDSYIVITTVASPGDSVKLPPVFGLYSIVFIKNDGANAADVFPATGHDLGAGVDTAVSIPAGRSLSFIATSESTVGSPTWTQFFVDATITEVNDLSAAVTWVNVPDANITQSSVTQHEGAIDHDQLLNFVANEHLDWTADQGATNINNANIELAVNDLTDAFNSTPADRHVLVYDGVTDNRYENRLLVEADISDLQSYLTAEVNDLTAAVTWANIPDANVPASAVTQHVGSIDHDQLLNFVANEHIDWTTDQGATNIDFNNNTVFTSVNQGVVPGSGGGTTNFLRADGTWTAPGGASFPEYLFYADQFENPNNADWDVNALAPAAADSNNAALTVRLFDDTTQEAVGMSFRLPATATNVVFEFVSRAETAPGGAVAAKPAIETRTIGDNAAVPAPPWTSLNLTKIDLPTNENFQYDSQTISFATLSWTAGTYVQMQLTRNPTHPDDNLVGDWALLSCRVSFT